MGSVSSIMRSATIISRSKMNPLPGHLLLGLVCLLILALAANCATPPKADAPLLPDALLTNEDERMLWQKSEKEQRALENNGLIYPDPELEDYLNQVAAKLKPRSAAQDLTIRVKVVKNSYLNAFAYPNGMIYLHTGLLARMESEDQLAAVLAHELIHCTRRHALRAFRMYKRQPAIVTAMQHRMLKTRGLQEMARYLGAAGAIAAISGYTRELEAEADRLGLELMVSAGYNPKAALFLFDQMMADIELEGLEEPFFFGSHPGVRQRADNLQNLPDSVYLNKGPAIISPEQFLAKLEALRLENARLDIRLGRFETAKRGIQKFLQINPDDSRAFFLLGEIYRQQGQPTGTREAIKNYTRAITLDPGYAAPHKAIGLIHYKKGHLALAKKFFESCLQLSPDAPDRAYIQRYLKQCTLSEEG